MFPVEQIVTDDRTNVVFIYTGTASDKGREITGAFPKVCNFGLVRGRGLRIWDDKSRQESVGLAAFTADDTFYTHANRSGRCFKGTVIVSVHRKACRAAAGTCELVKLKACRGRVVNFLNFFRHRVEIWQKEGYHNFTGRHQPLSVWAGTKLMEGGVPAFSYVTRI